MNEEALGATVLAIDYGAKRLGLAIKPAGQTMALPVGVTNAKSMPDAMEKLRGLIRERAVDIVVVGLPLNDDPAQALLVKRFARKLRQGITGVRWRFVDETLSTAEADDRAREAGFNPSKRATDDGAAAVILESWMQKNGAAA